ncbi:GrpB family protein [Paenibacillus sp. YAF4_2]|uniref:GrpB family protein n=1 Tax=Paenibacillus sp. YAF4_2 TaxID=3233085 RepID=UPI003F9D0EC1
MEDQWRIAEHDPQWRMLFQELGSKLRAALGELAIRIDHIGSTSVEGLDAKPIIDIQVSVMDYNDIISYKAKIEHGIFT